LTKTHISFIKPQIFEQDFAPGWGRISNSPDPVFYFGKDFSPIVQGKEALGFSGIFGAFPQYLTTKQ